MNFLWIDVETTGLYADKHDVVQLACIPVINGVRQKPFNEFCQPVNWDAVEDGAIRVHGITREMMRASQSPTELLDKLIKYLKSFNTRFVIAGYNVGFDKKFTASFFTKHNVSSHFFDLFELNIHDTYARAKEVKSQLPTENLKLETLANYYKVEIKAHDALSDIDATIEVDRQIGILLGEALALTPTPVGLCPCPRPRGQGQAHGVMGCGGRLLKGEVGAGWRPGS